MDRPARRQCANRGSADKFSQFAGGFEDWDASRLLQAIGPPRRSKMQVGPQCSQNPGLPRVTAPGAARNYHLSGLDYFASSAPA